MDRKASAPSQVAHTISIVVPVYQGERTLDHLIKEIADLTEPRQSRLGHEFRVSEVILVYDNGPDRSDVVIRRLAKESDFVRPVWLSRNFGQHAATLAGMASSGSDWIVTLDEDGQYDPAAIPDLLDVALAERVPLVYASPKNAAPHGWLRNAASKSAKWLFVNVLSETESVNFSSYRLVLGEYGRSVAAYCGAGVYLDVALGWVVGKHATCPVEFRDEGARRSGYSFRSLVSHFWRLVITSGTRPLRIASGVGLLMAIAGFVIAVTLLIRRLLHHITVEGWTSVIVALILGTGVILITLGVIAEYVGASVKMAMGRPLYLITTDPASTALGRDDPEAVEE